MSNEEQPNVLKRRLKFAAQLVVALLVSSFLVLSDDQRQAVAQALSDPLSVLAGRSPGARDGAELRQTKVRHEVVLPVGENLLSPERVMNPDDLADAPPVFTENSVMPLAYNDAVPVAGDTPAPGNVPGGGRFLGGGGFGPGLIGGGGGTPDGSGGGGDQCTDEDNCPTTPTGEPTPPPVVAIPEPTTWLMVIAGFFALGMFLRRRTKTSIHSAEADLGQQHSS